MVAARAAATGDATGLTMAGKKPTSLTYGDIFESARVSAAALREQGVQGGVPVLIIVQDAADFVATYFGVLFAGGIPVPLAPPLGRRAIDLEAYDRSLSRFIASSGARVAVVDGKLLLILRERLHAIDPSLRAMVPTTRGAPLANDELARPQPGDTALLQYTSGSTSDPKGVQITHRNLMSNIAAIESVLVGHPDDVCVTWLPLHHDMGLIGGVLTAMYAQVPIVVLRPQDFAKRPISWLKAISEYRGTITVSPNFGFGYCLSQIPIEELTGLDLSSMRVILNGAEPVNADLVSRFEEHFAAAHLPAGTVMPVYGLAEATLAVAFSRPDARVVDVVDADELETAGRAVPAASGARSRTLISVGVPLPTVEVRIAGDDGTVSDRRVGEICVRGPSVMAKYWCQPEATAETIRDGWLHTGDLGYVADGKLFITGREKDIVIWHGRNYYPEDIEANVAKLHGVRKGGLAAFAPDGADGVVVAVETRLSGAAERERLTLCIRETVADHHGLPVCDVVLLDPGTVPRSTSGKVRRRACQHQYEQKRLGAARKPAGLSLVHRLVRSSLIWAAQRLHIGQR